MDKSPDYVALTRELGDEFARLRRGVSPLLRHAASGEAMVMRLLDESAAPLTPGRLAARARVSSARMANVLRSLEEKGWVVRTHSSEDRRNVEVHVTEVGRSAVAQRRDANERDAAEFLSRLGEHDARELIRIVSRMADIVDEGRGRA